VFFFVREGLRVPIGLEWRSNRFACVAQQQQSERAEFQSGQWSIELDHIGKEADDRRAISKSVENANDRVVLNIDVSSPSGH
jgi:hypothetical protein